MIKTKYAFCNQLLLSLSDADLAALTPHLEPTSLQARETLASAHRPIERVYFPEGGLISVMAVADGGRAIQIGLIGLEGMTGAAVVLGDTQSAEETRVLIAGTANWIDATSLAALLGQHPTMHRAMLRFANVFSCQVAQTALTNGILKIDIRLARFLLMAADRVGGGDMRLTHEVIANLMSVRRPGITDAFHRLEGERVIQSRRSSVVIRDRAALEAIAGAAYGVPEREYRRCFEIKPSREHAAPAPCATDYARPSRHDLGGVRLTIPETRLQSHE